MKKIETHFYCDRCKKEVTENEYIRNRRRLLVKVREERKYIFAQKWKTMYAYNDEFELCEDCRENLELWLDGKNVPSGAGGAE